MRNDFEIAINTNNLPLFINQPAAEITLLVSFFGLKDNASLALSRRLIHKPCVAGQRQKLFLNVDPFVSSARVGDGLDDAHVTNAILETRARSVTAF